MTKTRTLIAIGVIVAVAGVVLGTEYWQRSQSDVLEPGSIPIYVNGEGIGGFVPADLEELDASSFVDAEEGKTQEGWLLRDVLLLQLNPSALQPDTRIIVSSSNRGRSVELTWAEVDDAANSVMLDLSGRGTLKLVSTLERLDTRDEWLQDVDKIEVSKP